MTKRLGYGFFMHLKIWYHVYVPHTVKFCVRSPDIPLLPLVSVLLRALWEAPPPHILNPSGLRVTSPLLPTLGGNTQPGPGQ